VFSEKLPRPESGELLELQERNFNNWVPLYADQPECAVTGDTCDHGDEPEPATARSFRRAGRPRRPQPPGP
ncbi:hypothetical protein, partial [Kocuria rhizosphaericola]|uniref:hypothetical protein n=1 Tax=Kocuria rhizosphaericola TaxID=3376284 RepID=UPI0037B9001A